ncbi:MAG: transposase, partial [Myxococcota bacterium]
MALPSGDGQLPLFAPSNSPLVVLDENHRLVRLERLLDWVELERRVQQTRRKKLKSRRGRRPNLRALIGAVILMGTRKMTYREAEDQIRHYGPARFLCGLTDSTWTPDHTTIQDFTELMGEDGLRSLNEFVLESAHREGLLDLKIVVGDTTAQEAHMSYPTEIGLMAGFLGMVSTAARRAGTSIKSCARELSEKFDQANQLVRKYRFFDKSKDERMATGKKLLSLTDSIKRKLKKALEKTERGSSRLKKRGKVARRTLERLIDSMTTLSPQIRYWLDTGWVAKKKLVNLLMPEVCSIP